MTWFDRWFMKMSKRAWDDANRVPVPVKDLSSIRSHDSLNFSIHPAVNGGYAVELSSYNLTTDTHKRELYIVGERSNLSKELAGIITQYKLRT